MDDIFHYGVPGMKWGVRKQRERKGSRHKLKKISRKKAAKQAAEMDYEELQQRVRRMELERKYTDYIGGREEKRGRTIVGSVLSRIGNRVFNRVIDRATDQAFEPIFDAIFGSEKSKRR